jgi:hypothetical protein
MKIFFIQTSANIPVILKVTSTAKLGFLFEYQHFALKCVKNGMRHVGGSCFSLKSMNCMLN